MGKVDERWARFAFDLLGGERVWILAMGCEFGIWDFGDGTCIFSLVVLFLLAGWLVGHEVTK